MRQYIKKQPRDGLSAYERQKRREAIANHWGLSTCPSRSSPKGWQRMARVDELSNRCGGALEKGGDEAAQVAALAALSLKEWRAVMDCLIDDFGRPFDVWRFAPTDGDIDRIDLALKRFPASEEHWVHARANLALTTWGPT